MVISIIYLLFNLIHLNKNAIMKHISQVCVICSPFWSWFVEGPKLLSIFREQKLSDNPKEWFKYKYLLKQTFPVSLHRSHFYIFQSEYLQDKIFEYLSNSAFMLCVGSSLSSYLDYKLRGTKQRLLRDCVALSIIIP